MDFINSVFHEVQTKENSTLVDCAGNSCVQHHLGNRTETHTLVPFVLLCLPLISVTLFTS